MKKENIEQNLSKELIDLVKEAMKSNVTKEEFKKFLEEKSRTNEDKSRKS
ncbi:DNA-binding anti-repressor SinI [Ectobacillus funiculus]|uniref:DNA-binding anti-repressor SinI n=1 Tax=Ectobacillus funiculus TaxID=137993 RepID=A0ABV5WFT2_9BACI